MGFLFYGKMTLFKSSKFNLEQSIRFIFIILYKPLLNNYEFNNNV